jgi:hypothetical protein
MRCEVLVIYSTKLPLEISKVMENTGTRGTTGKELKPIHPHKIRVLKGEREQRDFKEFY